MKRTFIILLLAALSALPALAKETDKEEAVKPDKSHRGLVSMSQMFVPKGQWLTGLNASFSTHSNDMYNIVIINDVNSEGYTVKVSPMLGYAVMNNMVVGVKFGYSRNLLRLDDGGISIGGDSGISLSADNYYSASGVWGKKGYYTFTFTEGGKPLFTATLSVPGLHNVSNSLAVAAVLRGYGFAPERIAAGISSYTGVLRRFLELAFEHAKNYEAAAREYA